MTLSEMDADDSTSRDRDLQAKFAELDRLAERAKANREENLQINREVFATVDAIRKIDPKRMPERLVSQRHQCRMRLIGHILIDCGWAVAIVRSLVAMDWILCLAIVVIFVGKFMVWDATPVSREKLTSDEPQENAF